MFDLSAPQFDDLSETQKHQLTQLISLYQEWNGKVNVVSKKDIPHLLEHHILHALSIGKVYPFQSGMRVIDMGTGGGFPGMPLAIMFPDTQFVLVDSIRKKIHVVEDICQRLQCHNVTPLWARIDNVAPHQFDVCLSRATVRLNELIKWAKWHLKPQSKAHTSGLICLKGGNLNEEINEAGVQPTIHPLLPLLQREFFDQKFLFYISQRDILN